MIQNKQENPFEEITQAVISEFGSVEMALKFVNEVEELLNGILHDNEFSISCKYCIGSWTPSITFRGIKITLLSKY